MVMPSSYRSTLEHGPNIANAKASDRNLDNCERCPWDTSRWRYHQLFRSLSNSGLLDLSSGEIYQMVKCITAYRKESQNLAKN